jgi:hypothetical protein
MRDLVAIAFILAAAVILDVTAILFGCDSRDGVRTDPFRKGCQLSESGRVYDS